MNKYYDHDGITIYHGDCREIWPQLKFDIVLTDPPYGNDTKYLSFKDTPENVKQLVQSVFPSLIKRARRTALTCGTRQIFWYPESTWILCWFNRAGNGLNPWGFTCWQPVLVYGKDPYLEAGKGSRPDYIEHSESSEKVDHPCPKPTYYWECLLNRISLDTSEIILDPLMGSGTTLLVAKKLRRKAIGIEIEKKYCDIAIERLSQEVMDFEPAEVRA